MSSTEFNEWYDRPADRCQLQLVHKPNQDPRNTCKDYRKRNALSRSLQCGIDSYGIGLGYKHLCVPPMKSRRTYFGSSLIGYEDASARYLATFLKNFAEKKRAFVILGDSLSYQTITSIQCELYREQVHFVKTGDDQIPMEGKGMFHFHFEDINKGVDVYYIRLDNIRIDRQYNGVKKELAKVLNSNNGKGGYFLLANIGLNYNKMDDYRTDIPMFFKWLNSLRKDGTVQVDVAWRETTASHWSYSANGYYDKNKRANATPSGLYCAPHHQTSMGNRDLRNEVVLNILKKTHKAQFDQIHYFPFYFATKDLWNMHTDFPPYPGGHSDCVHYCYHPQLWQPMWRYIHDVTMTGMSFIIK